MQLLDPFRTSTHIIRCKFCPLLLSQILALSLHTHFTLRHIHTHTHTGQGLIVTLFTNLVLYSFSVSFSHSTKAERERERERNESSLQVVTWFLFQRCIWYLYFTALSLFVINKIGSHIFHQQRSTCLTAVECYTFNTQNDANLAHSIKQLQVQGQLLTQLTNIFGNMTNGLPFAKGE